MDFNETLQSDFRRDPQYVCSFSGHQVKGQGHFEKKLEYYTEHSAALMDFNETYTVFP